MANKRKTDLSRHQRRQKEKGLPWGYIIPAMIIIIVVVGAVYVEARNGVTTTSTEYLLAPAGQLNYPFTCLGSESLYLHIHPWLRIVIDGHNVTIPGAIGIKNAVPAGQGSFGETYGGGSNSCFEPVHTHDFSGIIHIESPTNTNYTIGNFFNIWAESYAYALVNGTIQRPIVFNSTDILGYTTNSTYHLILLVDGQQSTAYGSLVLNTLDYCSAADTASSNPCSSTAGGNPSWNGGTSPYPYGTGHTIVIEYGPASSV